MVPFRTILEDRPECNMVLYRTLSLVLECQRVLSK